MNARTIIVAGALALVTSGLGFGFALVGSPEHNRQIQIDENRISAMQSLAGRFATGDVPGSARGDVPKTIARSTSPERPDQDLSGTTYAREGFGRYRICARFAQASANSQDYIDSDRDWRHPAGPYCFHLTAKSATPDRATRGSAPGAVRPSPSALP